MKFRFCLLASVFTHFGFGLLLWVLMGGHIPWREEMVIDLTGSFRTREASSLSGGGGKSLITKKLETNEMTGQIQSGNKEDGVNSELPIYDVSKLPELSDRESLKEKLERYYPPEARRNGQEGQVILEVVVSSSGKITQSRVIKSDPEIFAESAIKVCAELLFSPAYLGNRAVAVRIRLPIRFELEK